MQIAPVLSVSELNEVINRHLSLLDEVHVVGEIASINSKDQLVFLTIKDKYSAIDIFGLTHQLTKIFQLSEGDMVKVVATCGVYKKNSRFRLQARHISAVGRGEINRTLEELKQKLSSEGLFDKERKRDIPKYPNKIGLITAKNSSAYHDLVKILSSRMGGLSIKLLPVQVQGHSAVSSISLALKYVYKHPEEFDLVILARGGGSKSDLEAFNEEIIARLVFALKTPCISAIGHEDDWSIVDEVADARASTPSNAAELAVEDRVELNKAIQLQLEHAHSNLLHLLGDKNSHLRSSLRNLKSSIQLQKSQMLADISSLQNAATQLSNGIQSRRMTIQKNISSIEKHLRHHLEKTHSVLSVTLKSLNNTSPEALFERGFAKITSLDGLAITSVNHLQLHQTIATTLRDGTIQSDINTIKKGTL